MDTTNKSTGTDWMIFLVSTVIMIALVMFAAEWCWLPLPFSLTYLARALKVI